MRIQRQNSKQTCRGFSLLEILIVVSLVAVLLSLSVPSYKNYIRKSNRAEAVVNLLDWANRQAIWRADNPSYNLGIGPPADQLYVYTINANTTSFTLTATAQGGQTSDKEDGISCTVLTLNQAGVSGPAGHEACWSH